MSRRSGIPNPTMMPEHRQTDEQDEARRGR